MEYLGNLRNTVANAFNAATATPQPPALSRNDVLGLEENERTRRMAQVSQSNVDKQNAANISGLIKKQSFPVFRGNVSRGYKRVTTRFEEEERRRRLTNKSESALRRANGNKTSRMVQELGWPFYQQNHNGPEYLVMDPTKILEEEEREWRTSKQYWGPTAKHNAAMVANILRWSNFQRNPRAGFARHVKFIEEKERKERMQNMERDMQNAYNEAGLIKQKGAPFYVQEPLSSKRDYSEINRIEELERKRRMGNREEEQLAHELAGLVKNDLPHTSSKSLHRDASKSMDVGSEELEEQERGRRMLDVRQQNIAKQNAKNVSLMVRESSSNKLTGTGPMWFSISRNSMRALEEIERTRRLRDIEGQRDLRQGAKLVSDMISGRLAAPAKPSIHAIEEEERNSRLHDRQQQQIAIKTARKVSGLIARHNLMSNNSKSFTLAEEESERTRRLQDQNQQMLARNNAKKVASLVSSLNVAPGNKHALPTESLPTYSAPVTASPIAINMPLQKELPRIPTSAPISAAPISAAPISAAPISAAPVSAAPIASAPLAKSVAPISAAPISAPIVSAPIVSAPLAKSVAPISAAPIASAPISAPIVSAPLAKSVAPISAAPVSAAPVFSAPVSAAPITSAPRSAAPLASVVSPAPLSSAPLAKPTAPIFTAPVSSAPITTSPLVQSAPVSAAPIARSAPISAAPITRSAPISAAPITRSAPISAAPITRSAPTSSNVQPIVLSSTSAPVPVAPLATATSVPITRSTSFNTSVPSMTTVPISAAPVRASSFNTAPTVPIDTAAIAHASLGDRERKRLLKQADRHNKHSERSVRKAEKSMLKAEKMHQKGRDDKALKLESKAEQFMKTAEHERRWASGIQGELAPNAPAPASM